MTSVPPAKKRLPARARPPGGAVSHIVRGTKEYELLCTSKYYFAFNTPNTIDRWLQFSFLCHIKGTLEDNAATTVGSYILAHREQSGSSDRGNLRRSFSSKHSAALRPNSASLIQIISTPLIAMAGNPPQTASAPPTSASLKSFQDKYKLVQTKKNPNIAARRPPIQQPSNLHLFVRAGLPFLLFSVGASLMLKSGLEGKNTDRDKSKGFVSKSERQARLDAERDQMMEKLNKRIKTVEFDNTKRIERPEEILERRKKERDERNRWYKRSWRWVTRQS